MKIKIVIITCMFILAACTNNDNNVSETLENEVIYTDFEHENEVSTNADDVNKIASLSVIDKKLNNIENEFNDNKSYKSFFDLPFNEMIFAEKSIFENLKEQYSLIEFSGKFEVGNIEKSRDYLYSICS